MARHSVGEGAIIGGLRQPDLSDDRKYRDGDLLFNGLAVDYAHILRDLADIHLNTNTDLVPHI